MFGLYRYVLAALVIVSHLGSLGLLGWYAVQGFFVLSGFLMTAVMHRDYGYTASGMARFGLNRLLRLWPMWWAILAISVLIISRLGGIQAFEFSPKMKIPSDLNAWVSHVTLIFPNFFPASAPEQISPPIWTLTVELLFYALIALGLSRRTWLCWIWLGAAMIYLATTHVLGLDVIWRYSSLMAGALPFSLGGLLYHCKSKLVMRWPAISTAGFRQICIGLICLNLFYGIFSADSRNGWVFSITFYLNIILQAALILHLAGHRAQGSIVKWLDRIGGDLSYPIYLLHMPIAFAVSMIVFGQSARFEADTALIIIALTLFISSALGWILILSIDRPIQKLRNYIRPKSDA